MLIKKYSIPILCRITSYVDQALNNYSDFQTIQALKKDFGYRLKSNSNNISEGYKTTDIKALPKTFYNSYMISQEEGVPDTSLQEEIIKNPLHLDDPKKFFNRYSTILKPYKDKVLEIKEKDFKIYFIKLTEDMVYMSHKEGYEDITEDYEEFSLVLETPKIIERLTDSLDISEEQLILLEEGYYNIYPRLHSNTVEGNSDYTLKIFSGKFSKIYSKDKVSVNGWILNSTTLPPNTSIEIEVNEKCLNPLVSVSEENKYIVYETKNKKLTPSFILSKEGSDPSEEVKNLLKSHQEFLRAYSYVVDSCKVMINDNEVTIKNKDFQHLKDNLIAEDIPHYNFNL